MSFVLQFLIASYGITLVVMLTDLHRIGPLWWRRATFVLTLPFTLTCGLTVLVGCVLHNLLIREPWATSWTEIKEALGGLPAEIREAWYDK